MSDCEWKTLAEAEGWSVAVSVGLRERCGREFYCLTWPGGSRVSDEVLFPMLGEAPEALVRACRGLPNCPDDYGRPEGHVSPFWLEVEGLAQIAGLRHLMDAEANAAGLSRAERRAHKRAARRAAKESERWVRREARRIAKRQGDPPGTVGELKPQRDRRCGRNRRSIGRPAMGEGLTPAERDAIVADTRTQREIAETFGISQSRVSAIKRQHGQHGRPGGKRRRAS